MVRLTGSREVRGIWMHEDNEARLDLRGHLLTVGEGGINGYYNENGLYIKQGAITASGTSLVIQAGTYGSSAVSRMGEKIWRNLHIESEIRDNATHKVGLVLKGTHPVGRKALVRLGGTSSNTFTGDVVIEGSGNMLFLAKQNGATAIASKSIYVKAGGRLAIASSNQISDSSTVTLTGNGSMFSFAGSSGPEIVEPASEKVHTLVVERGKGIFHFTHSQKFKDVVKKTIILDDLIINDGASLRIVSWEEGRDHFLVCKDSKHLADAMKKISIDGWAKNQIYLKSYDKDYWSIEAAPEPATYGAIFGGVALALMGCRQRRRRCESE